MRFGSLKRFSTGKVSFFQDLPYPEPFRFNGLVTILASFLSLYREAFFHAPTLFGFVL